MLYGAPRILWAWILAHRICKLIYLLDELYFFCKSSFTMSILNAYNSYILLCNYCIIINIFSLSNNCNTVNKNTILSIYAKALRVLFLNHCYFFFDIYLQTKVNKYTIYLIKTKFFSQPAHKTPKSWKQTPLSQPAHKRPKSWKQILLSLFTHKTPNSWK